MSTRELLLEELRDQPEQVLRDLRKHLQHLTGQSNRLVAMDEITSDTWEKIGPAPDVDYDKL